MRFRLSVDIEDGTELGEMNLTQPSKRQNLEGATRIRDHLLRLAKEGHALRRPASAPLADEFIEEDPQPQAFVVPASP